jgi:hypothetical protein
MTLPRAVPLSLYSHRYYNDSSLYVIEGHVGLWLREVDVPNLESLALLVFKKEAVLACEVSLDNAGRAHTSAPIYFKRDKDTESVLIAAGEATQLERNTEADFQETLKQIRMAQLEQVREPKDENKVYMKKWGEGEVYTLPPPLFNPFMDDDPIIKYYRRARASEREFQQEIMGDFYEEGQDAPTSEET